VTGPTWRLLVTEPCDGATNMAIDEVLWRRRQAGAAPATLRFFAWAPPTVSLGYGQRLDESIDVEACRRLGVGLVRRPTGGSAICHDGPARELTYSVAASTEDLGVSADLLQSYRWIGSALLRGLNALGAGAELVPVVEAGGTTPAFCFARTGRYEIEIGGRKVVGSAQRRQGSMFLQHGAILLGIDERLQRAVFPTTRDPLGTLTTLDAALGRAPSWDEMAETLADAFATEHDLVLKPDGLTAEETARVAELVRTRYGTDAWLRGPREAARWQRAGVPADGDP
jgi:lipoate-protein ligase A